MRAWRRGAHATLNKAGYHHMVKVSLTRRIGVPQPTRQPCGPSSGAEPSVQPTAYTTITQASPGHGPGPGLMTQEPGIGPWASGHRRDREREIEREREREREKEREKEKEREREREKERARENERATERARENERERQLDLELDLALDLALALESGLKTQDSRLRTQDSGRRNQDSGLRTHDSGKGGARAYLNRAGYHHRAIVHLT